MPLVSHAPCPSLIFPSAVIDKMLPASEIETSPLARRNLCRTLMFLAQGLEPDQLGQRVAQPVAALRSGADED